MIKLKSDKELKGNYILNLVLNNTNIDTLNYTKEEKEEIKELCNYMKNKL
ncbi:hypothetical protein UT300012_32510 [Paraclostridium bifermentans]|jgi:hypothetical protein